MASTAATVGVMDRLKAATHEHHARAEGKSLQQSMVQGRIPRARFAAFLGQMLHVHTALEELIDIVAAADARVRVIPPEQRHAPRIREDLRFFGADATGVSPIAPTEALIGRMRQSVQRVPMAVLGLHYVLEGSMNGNRYIAKAVRKSLALAPGEGDRYLDPYGEAQRAGWLAFRAEVDKLAWTDGEIDAAIDAARTMFDGIGDISEALSDA